MNDRPELSIVLPCHDEAMHVERVVAALDDAAAEVTACHEIIVVDDGSTDGTAAVAGGLDRPTVRVVRLEHNQGYGAALRRGFDEAQLDWIMYMDADGQYDAADLAKVASLLADGVVVAGYRAPRRDPLLRRLCGRCWTAAVNGLLGLRCRDVDCGLKVIPRQFARTAALEASGAVISAEILVKATAAGLHIVQTPVRHHRREAGRPSGASPRVVLRAFGELATLRRSMRRRR